MGMKIQEVNSDAHQHADWKSHVGLCTERESDEKNLWLIWPYSLLNCRELYHKTANRVQQAENKSEIWGVTLAGPVVDDDRKSLMAAIANGAAMNDDGNKKYQSGNKNDKRGGETLIVVDIGEETMEDWLLGVTDTGKEPAELDYIPKGEDL